MTNPVPPPGEHGDDAVRVAQALGIPIDEVLDLATSLNPVAPDLRLLMATTLSAICRYPDPTAATRALAGAMGVDPAWVLLTNGGAEAIALVGSELGTGSVTDPEFSLYRRHLSQVTEDGGKWRSNPHNPTGRLALPEDRSAVWDEAFFPLAKGTWTRGDAQRGSIVVGSLTKLFACPGLRLGYILTSDASLLARLARRQPQWSVSSVALAMLPKMLELADLEGWRSSICNLREQLCSVLRRAGLAPERSDSNFVLVREAPGLRDRLALLGVVVRDCASFGLTGAVRIAVPDSAGLERLEAALDGRASVGSGRWRSRPEPARELPSPRPGAAGLRGAILVCGTASDAGKSQIVTGLCRLLSRRGVRVAPFKAQNMSLNSYATPSGHEIGRAQGTQALAAGIEPEVAMNPILLKPTSSCSSQVVVMGEPLGDLDASSYQQSRRAALFPVVLGALQDLRSRYDVVICEGAGSPAEINLLKGDITNLGLAEAAGMPGMLVGDIERGGVFASIAGTFSILPEHLSRHLRAFMINKFRGDPALLGSGIEALEEVTGRPCAGVVPYLGNLTLDAEDSLGLAALIGSGGPRSRDCLDVAVVNLPHLANFTDLDALSIEEGLSLRLVDRTDALGGADLVILPGSKATVADLVWLQDRGLDLALRAAAAEAGGPTILGICAGYQMLGRGIDDDFESRAGHVEAIGLLPVVTTFYAEKRTRPRRGRSLSSSVSGYEIHQGEPVVVDADGTGFLLELDDAFGRRPEGCVSRDGRVVGTNLHGLFESDGFRGAFLSQVAERRGKRLRLGGARFEERRDGQMDRLADALEAHLDLDLVFSLINSAAEAPT
ncbi:MAG: cobyric acid synthase [Acidimicrobiales bacterium]